jgi:hypothetical protein
MARTVMREALMAPTTLAHSPSSGRLSPMPKSPSMTRAPGCRRCLSSHCRAASKLGASPSRSRVVARSGRRLAATTASLPLLPGPASTRTGAPGWVRRRAAWATAAPAARMTSSRGTPAAQVRASRSRISATERIGSGMGKGGRAVGGGQWAVGSGQWAAGVRREGRGSRSRARSWPRPGGDGSGRRVRECPPGPEASRRVGSRRSPSRGGNMARVRPEAIENLPLGRSGRLTATSIGRAIDALAYFEP